MEFMPVMMFKPVAISRDVISILVVSQAHGEEEAEPQEAGPIS